MRARLLAACVPALLAGALVSCGAILGIPSDIGRESADAADDTRVMGSETGGPEGGEDHVVANDGGEDADGNVPPVDAGPRCDPTKNFSVPGILNSVGTSGTEGSVRLTEDEKTIYFSKGSVGSDFDMYMATRLVLTDSFFGITPIAGAVNTTTSFEFSPNITDNGLSIIFERQDPISEDSNLFVATRATPNGSFATATAVPDVNSFPGYDAKPFVRGDGSEIYYTKAVGAGGTTDILLATKSGASFTVAPVPGVNDPSASDYTPVISRDGLKMYFASNRPSGGPLGYNIWVAERATKGADFGTPTLVPNVNSDAFEEPGWISPDDCVLYMSSQRGGKQLVYVAKRPL